MSKRTWHDFDDFDDLGSKYSEAFLKEQGMRYGLDPTLPRYQREDTGSQEAFQKVAVVDEKLHSAPPGFTVSIQNGICMT